jgi:hypothetical protein
MSLSEMLETRDVMLSREQRRDGGGSLVERSLALSLEAAGGGDDGSGVSKRTRQEVAEYVRSGSLSPQPHAAPNVTLLQSPSLQYTLYFSSSVLRALPLAAEAEGVPLAARLLGQLAPRLEAMASELRAGRASVTLVLGDMLTLATDGAAAHPATSSDSPIGAAAFAPSSSPSASPASSSGLFDYVDGSNIADYVSVSLLLQACAPLLVASPHARVRMESFVQYRLVRGTPKGRTFAQDAVGLSAGALAALLRVRLVGTRELPGQALRMEWAALGPIEDGGGGRLGRRPLARARALLQADDRRSPEPAIRKLDGGVGAHRRAARVRPPAAARRAAACARARRGPAPRGRGRSRRLAAQV